MTRYGETLDLFGSGPATRSADPETSHEAAASISADRLRVSQRAVLALFARRGPMTDTEVRVYYDPAFPPQSRSGLRTRRAELTRAGLLRDSMERKTLGSGRRSVVWEITPAGVGRL